MIIGMAIFYGVTKFIDMYEGNDPNIRQNLIPDSYGPSDKLNFSTDINFRLALGARLYRGVNENLDKTLFHDPRLVRWMARLTSLDDNGILISKNFPLHDCTEEDFEEFHPL